MARKISRRKQAEERRQKRVRMAMGIFIISIMVLSSIAFIVVFYSTPTQNGYPFDYEIRDNQLLVRTSNGAVEFVNFPDERYTLPSNATGLLQDADVVVLAFDPHDNDTAQYAELIRFDLSSHFEVAGARTADSDSFSQFPVVDCSDATADAPIVLFDNQSIGSSVNGSCLVFGASGVDTLYVRDALLYSYYDLL